MMRRMDPPRIVFILSTNYAGSHLLAQLLAAHSRCAGVGELHNYRKFRERGSRSGNVVNDYLEHPAFAGLDTLPVRQWHGRIMERLREQDPRLSHLVDNSKRPAWARRFPVADSYSVHLLRDPRALVSRWINTYETPSQVRSQRLRVLRRKPWAIGGVADTVGIYVEKWLIANRAISRHLVGRKGAVVTYRDLALTTEATLRNLMPSLDLTFEPEQLHYGAAEGHLGTRKRDYLNAAECSVIQIDLRWRDHLSVSERSMVECHRGVNRYLRSLGLRMTDEGLTPGSDEI
jgi:hypothetical protein